MKKILIRFSDELLEAIDHARASSKKKQGRAELIEELLWKCNAIKKAAKAAGIQKPDRIDNRGEWMKAQAKKNRKAS